MSTIINLTEVRLSKKHQKPASARSLVEDAKEFLLGDWEKMAKNNRLNDYFIRTVPHLSDDRANYMSDLNAISVLELNIDFFPMIFFPGTKNKNQLGWVVQFILNETEISTPELANEAYARCFAVLLYLKVKRDFVSAGV